jgi:hypothetical protein
MRSISGGKPQPRLRRSRQIKIAERNFYLESELDERNRLSSLMRRNLQAKMLENILPDSLIMYLQAGWVIS